MSYPSNVWQFGRPLQLKINLNFFLKFLAGKVSPRVSIRQSRSKNWLI